MKYDIEGEPNIPDVLLMGKYTIHTIQYNLFRQRVSGVGLTKFHKHMDYNKKWDWPISSYRIIMGKSEVDILSRHVKVTTENLLKLHPKTPEPVVFFLAGKLPGEALLHLKQLTLFGMICQLRGNILNNLAVKLLTNEKQTSKNWFAEIRSHCFTYNMPHPLLLLRDPPSKEHYKKLLKTNITDFWQQKLREQCVALESKSLKYFKPKFMSLRKPHPMYTYMH